MSKKPLRIFLYTDGAALSEDHRKALEDGGFIPILVANLDACKIIEPPISVSLDVVSLDLISHAAISTVNAYSGGVVEHFGKRVAAAVSGAIKAGR